MVPEPTVALDDAEAPFFRWFSDGTLNLSYNCLDRHLEDRGDKVAHHWVGEPGETRDLTYRDLYLEVCRFANALPRWAWSAAIVSPSTWEWSRAPGGDARLLPHRSPHSVVFGGFSSDSLADRINDGEAKVLVTQDGAWRGGTSSPSRRTPMSPWPGPRR